VSKICVVGLWHLGSVTAACLADLGHSVTAIDSDPKVIEGLSRGVPPVFEPGLEEMLRKNIAAGRMEFLELSSVQAEHRLGQTDLIWVTCDTPVDDDDEASLDPVYEAIDVIAKHGLREHLQRPGVVLVSSQVPVGTCAKLQARIRSGRVGGREISVAYSPENLRLGDGIRRFLEPDMFVIGGDDEWTHRVVELALLASDDDRVLRLLLNQMNVSLQTAEMVKHAINAFLATSVAFAGEIASACEAVGVDAMEVAKALRLDSRIGPKARVLPGPGFAGGTLARDLRVLQHLGEEHRYMTPLLDAVFEVSDRQNRWAISVLEEALSPIKGKTIGVVGLAYTTNTSTLRRSLAIEVIGELADKGAQIRAYDPTADRAEVALHSEIELVDRIEDLVVGAHALVTFTACIDLWKMDWRTAMARPLFVDAGNVVERPEVFRENGWEYYGVGR